jgi:hypothetical protein
MLEPWKDMQDDIIEIPDGAGLSDHTRSDLVELWTSGGDVGFHDPYTPVRPHRIPLLLPPSTFSGQFFPRSPSIDGLLVDPIRGSCIDFFIQYFVRVCD